MVYFYKEAYFLDGIRFDDSLKFALIAVYLYSESRWLSMPTGMICESIIMKPKKKLGFLMSLNSNYLKLKLALEYHRLASKSQLRH